MLAARIRAPEDGTDITGREEEFTFYESLTLEALNPLQCGCS